MTRRQRSTSIGRTKRLYLVVLCTAAGSLVELGGARDARAWDPIRSASRSAARGLAEGAAPTIERLGHDLISDVNSKAAERIDQIQGTLAATVTQAAGEGKRLVTQLDLVAQARLDQTDSILERRITQVGGVANAAVANAVGGLDQVAQKRIAQAEASGLKLIKALDETEARALEQVDVILQNRIGQLDDIVARSLDDVDEILRERIEQVDEVTERRLGNADVIATRQGVAIESSLLQVGEWLALLAFGIYVCIKGYQDFDRYWDEHKDRGEPRLQNAALSIAKALPWLLLRTVAGAACVGLVYLGIQHLPKQSEDRLGDLVRQNEADFRSSCETLDFARVRFYDSQLQLLETDPARRERYRYEARKYELARNVLSRAALLKTPQGVRQVVAEVRALDNPKQPDADLLALKAYISFRVSQMSDSRLGEWEAADMAKQALAVGPGPQAPGIASKPRFKPLAAAVLRALLEDPVPGSQVEAQLNELRASLAPFAGDVFGPLKHADIYDQKLAELNRKSSNGFIRLLDGQVELKKANAGIRKRPANKEPNFAFDAKGAIAVAGLREPESSIATAMNARRAGAREVIAAWTAFDEALRSNGELSNSNAVFAAFTLNDAVLTQALWVEKHPTAMGLALPLKQIPLDSRLGVTPVRVEWARRYGNALNRGANWLFGFEEARRFEQYEVQVQEFIAAYLALRAPDPKAEPGKSGKPSESSSVSPELRAALAAAALGLYQGDALQRRAFGLTLLPANASADDREHVLEEYGKRHVMFL